MHFIVTWEIYVEGEERETIDQALQECLEGYEIVRVLNTSYVVKIDRRQQFAALHKAWSDVAEAHQGQVEFIMSPLMKAGQYAGYFRQEKWEKLTVALEQGQEGQE